MSYSVAHGRLQERLHASGSTASASEAHGILCGLISSAGKADFRDWLKQVMGHTPDAADVLMAETITLLEDLFVESEKGMASELYEFELLLPDDDQALTDRVRALGEWCEGYLLGFSSGRGESDSPLPAEIDDVIRTFVEFSRVDDNVDEASELDEQALVEVSEYVRLNVLMVLEAMHPEGPQL